MSKYTTSILIAVPMALMPIAPPIAQAFDPDSGGARSFDTVRATDASGAAWAICHSPSTADTAAAIPYLQIVPGLLHQSVTRDFELRWSGETPPTLEACEAFRTGIKFIAGLPLAESLAAMGLTLNKPEEQV